jgi:peptidoglycan/xylan/chitin deacetylase (PgdA/CDA1 family)
MKTRALICAALFVAALVSARGMTPPAGSGRLVPPSPRDGEGTGSTIVPILIFHSTRPYIESDTPAVRRYIATPDTMEQELAYLRDHGYVSVTFDDLVSHITNNTPLPQRPVILSFDDDWESQYTYAFPLLEKYGFTATFYIWTAVVGREHHMTWDEISTLARAGMQIGCHTITHPYLTRVKSDESLRREIIGARTLIEERVGVPVTTFAYPFGQYNERVAAMVKEAGFTSARSTWPGVLHCQEGLFSLTGLLQTESTQDLVASLDASLAEARQKTAGTAAHAG